MAAAGCRLSPSTPATATAAVEKGSTNDWERFDPRAEDLEIETVSEMTENGVKVTRLYFTSHKIDVRPVRIYGIYARPEQVKGRIPAILFIHGGGQTADEPEAVGMARNGYAVFSHDWKCSELPDQENHPSKWPFDAQGKRLTAEKYLDSPAWIARRALTVLERQPEVDARRMGVYGFSWGGFNTWTIAATDARVKVANPSCGVLWGKEPLMSRVGVPVLFTDASNDFFAKLDAAQTVMEAVKVECRRLIAPNENHNMAGTAWEATRLKWFDHYLKGGAPLAPSPILSVKTVDGSLTATVKAPAATVCQLIYSYGTNTAVARCWFGKTMRQTGRGAFAVDLPRREGVDLWYFVNSEYKDGTALSSKYEVLKADPAKTNLTVEAGGVLYDPAVDGPYPWYFSWRGPVADHPWHSWNGTRLAVSPDIGGRPALYIQSGLTGTNGLGLFRAFVRSPGCPLRQAGGATRLSLYVLGARPLRVNLAAHAGGDWTGDNKHAFRASLELASGEGWTPVEIPAQSFSRENPTTRKTETMRSFDGVQQFHVMVESADQVRGLPAIGRIEWRP
jgi:dienelactone hydrolase